MAELIASTPRRGLALPIDTAEVRLDAFDPGRLSWLAPYPGMEQAMSAALQMPFPAVGEVVSTPDARLVWCGRSQAMLMGAAAPPEASANGAVIEQSDGWVSLSLVGQLACDILARLCPNDLAAPAFPPGTAARVMLNHLHALVIRTEHARFEIFIPRSMAQTAVHEIGEAAQRVIARAAIDSR